MPKKKLENLVSTKSDTEKVYDAFLRRYRKFWDTGSGMNEHDIVEMWDDWVESLDSVEHIKKFSNVANSVDYLLECVNQPGFDKVVVRDPGDHNNNFLVLDRDFADKVLVLGDIP